MGPFYFKMAVMFIFILFTLSVMQASQRLCRVEEKRTLVCNHMPENIPNGILNVRVKNLGMSQKTINSTNFKSENWRYIERLELSGCKTTCGFVHFANGTFVNLVTLSELHIHLHDVYLDSNVFDGQLTVNLLDVSDCPRLTFDKLFNSLNGTNKLPALKHLKMKKINSYHYGQNILDARVGKVLQAKNIISLDLGYTDIALFDFHIFKYLAYIEVMNISSANINNFGTHEDRTHDFANITLDLSHATMPLKSIPPYAVYSDVTLNISVFEPSYFFEFGVLNISSIKPTFPISFKNITLIVDIPPMNFPVKHMILKDINIKYFDVHCVFTNNNATAYKDVKELNLAENGLQYVDLSCAFRDLKALDMSSNQLGKMAISNRSAFEEILHSLYKLQFVSLSRNGLQMVPKNMFKNNFALNKIDLSGNQLTQITFTMDNLDNLEVLDLHDNNIYYLDTASLGHLDSIPVNKKQKKTCATVLLRDNPLSCAVCDYKSSISWILNSLLVNISSQNLYCTKEDGKLSRIDKDIVHVIENICNRVVISIATCVSPTCLIILGIVIGQVLYKYYKRLRMRKKRHEIICSLRNSKDHNKYAAFFIAQCEKEGSGEQYENIIAMLNDNLLRIIGPRCHYDPKKRGQQFQQNCENQQNLENHYDPTHGALVHHPQQDLQNHHGPTHGALVHHPQQDLQIIMVLPMVHLFIIHNRIYKIIMVLPMVHLFIIHNRIYKIIMVLPMVHLFIIHNRIYKIIMVLPMVNLFIIHNRIYKIIMVLPMVHLFIIHNRIYKIIMSYPW
ncbi:uncharacterized protein LOC132713249 [Ruditapes philippinarum]|uniref:uncharacterized protein LOC132713249 n=1 Tax=Ruditapes philippinarum TaxID=129788 RepID=UPI00295ADD95|nr:uncharacterized protein LOC132713249 [Ruditapes philippinarum]